MFLHYVYCPLSLWSVFLFCYACLLAAVRFVLGPLHSHCVFLPQTARLLLLLALPLTSFVPRIGEHNSFSLSPSSFCVLLDLFFGLSQDRTLAVAACTTTLTSFVP